MKEVYISIEALSYWYFQFQALVILPYNGKSLIRECEESIVQLKASIELSTYSKLK